MSSRVRAASNLAHEKETFIPEFSHAVQEHARPNAPSSFFICSIEKRRRIYRRFKAGSVTASSSLGHVCRGKAAVFRGNDDITATPYA